MRAHMVNMARTDYVYDRHEGAIYSHILYSSVLFPSSWKVEKEKNVGIIHELMFSYFREGAQLYARPVSKIRCTFYKELCREIKGKKGLSYVVFIQSPPPAADPFIYMKKTEGNFHPRPARHFFILP